MEAKEQGSANSPIHLGLVITGTVHAIAILGLVILAELHFLLGVVWK